MIGSGKRLLTGLSLLTFVLGTVLSVSPVLADGQNVEPSVNTVINFPAFPNAGGPYITQVTWRPPAVSGAPASEAFLVFNEDINPATVDASGSATNVDFIATGFTFASVTVAGNVITLNDATAVAGHMIQLAEIGCIEGTDGSPSSDLTPVEVGEGPVITGIVLTGYEDDDPTNDVLTVTFDEEVEFASGGNVNNSFTLTPEFGGVTLEATWENDPTDDGTFVAITQDGASANDLFQMKPGVTKLWVQDGRFEWTAVATENSLSYQLPIENEGPHVVAAYYNDNGTDLNLADDSVWVIMSDPVDPVSITGGVTDHFAVGGTFGPSVGDVNLAFPGSQTSALLITNTDVAAAPADGAGTIGDGATDLLDYQGDAGAASVVSIARGPGIIRSSFDDQGTVTRTDDQLIIWINEPMSRAAVIGDFVFTNVDLTGLTLTVSTETIGDLTRVRIDGWESGQFPMPGSQVNGAPGSGFLGGVSGDELADISPICIEDESRPYSVEINEDLDLTYDIYDSGSGTDSVFIAWSETGGDDSDQYFLFYSATPNLDDDWMNANLSNAIPLGNLHPYGTDDLIRIGFTIVENVSLSTDGIVLATGDQMRVIIAAADYQGNVARIQDNNESAEFFGPFIVGPLCSPRDFITDASLPSEPDSMLWDHDVIHVVGDSLDGMVWHYVYGDSGAIPCDADSVLVYDGPDPALDMRLGGGIPNPDGSFSPIHIESPDTDCVYLINRQNEEYSAATTIIYDRTYPEILGDAGTTYPDYVFDPWNPYRCYNDGDYINIRLLANDGYTDCAGTTVEARSALLHIWADFSQVDLTSGNVTGFGTPADSILFTSLGADEVDNDNDWDTFTDVDGSGDYDLGEPLNDDVGLDGVDGTNDPGEGDGMMTFGDPFVDENGSGTFEPGETFLNVKTTDDGSSGDHIWDPGEPDLDSRDPDEFGWYEVTSQVANGVRGTVQQGYPLANPNPNASLDPFTPVPIYVSDNGIDGAERPDAFDRNLPFADAIADSNRSLSHLTVHAGGDPERRFVARIDVREPTHAEITYLANETDMTSDGGDNLIAPGSPTYNLGRWVDFTSSSLSDADVLYSRIRLRPSLGDWVDLTLDPGPDFGSASDANGDNFPGAMEYDEDADSTATQAGGFDDDEDGEADEVGEGIDFSDREVHAASQDSTADAAATYGNGLHCMNDYTDNDNDAFFVYDSYANGGLAGGGAVGKIRWYNIDESRTNNFDDDNDGQVDEADEEPENVGYGNGENDDNEDGIADGEAVAVPVSLDDSGFSTLGINDPPMPADWDAPTPGPGVDPTVIYVDASHIMGTRPITGTNSDTEPFYGNGVAYSEVVGHGYEVLTASARTFPTTGYTFGGAADSTSSMEFNFFDTHSSENLDFELLTNIYGLTADGETQHQLRLVAADKAGNTREVWSEPISFTLDLTAPPAEIPGCDDSGDAPEDFADVDPDTDGIQIYDAGKHPGTYTLTGVTDADAVEMTFEASSDPEFDTIDFTVTDMTAPFTAEWPDGGSMFFVDNYPAANADTVYFRARATDEFGNTTAEEDLCVLQVIVIDGTEPTATLVQIHDDTNLEDGACVPPDSSIALFADIDDNDDIGWTGGLDVASGDAGVDDDGDGDTDEDDVNGNGIYEEGIDDAGLDGIPGTDDDEWNGSSVAGNFGETDDYQTNDIVQVIFEYNPVGDMPDLGWLPIETVHGDTFSTGGQTVDWTDPVVATWNTINLETGDYDIRAYAIDIEGNSGELTAFITTVCIRSEPLRAYIQPEVCAGTTQFDLYALHYIHDYEIDRVRFEYFYDMDGDNCATDLDVGSSWLSIATDDEDTGRGDAVLYFPSAERVTNATALEDIAYVFDMNDGDENYKYWDPDNDGYSHRDPVVVDDNNDGFFSLVDDDFAGGGDYVVIGDATDIPDGVALTEFEDDEYYADVTLAARGGAAVRPQGWIFKENRLTGDNNALDRWNVSWDGTGLPEGNYLVRSIAIDETNQEDVIEYTCYEPENQNPEEIEAVRIDTEEPEAEFTTITLPDGTELDVSAPDVQPYVAGVNDWLELCAAGSDDIARVLFEISLDGGVTWDNLDVNNDQDWYADIDDELGFQAEGEDEIFNDINGNFMYDSGVDFVRFAGANGVVDTPDGWPLRPLVGEDPIDGDDNDLDGVVDEDPTSGDPAADEPGSPEDYSDPYCVYLDIQALPLWADVNVLFRATAYDYNCDTYRADDDPAVLAVIIGENVAPEADVIRVEDPNGAEIDVFPAIMDGDGVASISDDTDSMAVFVTAEDITAIVEVDLMWRLDPGCYADLTFEQMQWKSMSDEGWTMVDTVYPYDFIVNTDLIPDGAYQFYPSASDEGGNMTNPPTNPWEFNKFGNGTADFAFIDSPAPPPAEPDTAAVGDEYTMTADIPTGEAGWETTSVRFWFAPRRLGESIDPTMVQPLAPYVSEPLAETVLSVEGVCDGVAVYVNGEMATCHESLAGVAAPTVLDVTVDAGSNAIVFGARPAAEDVVTVSYNFGAWTLIESGDEFGPYSVEWTAEDGGVPDPADFGWDVGNTDAYDLIAQARFDLNGDWLFGGDCDVDETPRSEGNYLVLEDQDRPEVMIWGLAYSEEPRDNQDAYPDWNTPGNPLFTCGDDINDDSDYDHAFILSGKETDVFVTAEDVGGGTIESVTLDITSENPETGETAEMSYDMNMVGTSVTTIDALPVTFYPEDYTQWDPTDIENVILYVSTDEGASWPYKFEMDEMEDCFQINPRLFVGTTHWYEFEVDLVGDTQDRVVDARNNGPNPVPGAATVSIIDVPSTPFWHVNVDGSMDLYPARVHRAVATATDDNGNSGTTMNSNTPGGDQPQGPVVFIYDVEDPVLEDGYLTVLTDIDRPFAGDRVSPANEYHIWASVNDNPYEDFNVLRIDWVEFQYSPNQGGIWFEIETDSETEDGWWVSWTPDDQGSDGYDNDLDGIYDEDDERISPVWLRAVVKDCGYNIVYGDPFQLLIDSAEPTTCPTSPLDGAVYKYSDTITIAGIPEGDWVATAGSNDIAEVRFQARFSALFFVDETFNGNGHGGDYDNGIDEIWFDADADRTFSSGDVNMYPGADGIASTFDGSDANIWFTLDPTPLDNSDDPWLEAPNNGAEYTMTWTPAGSQFTEFGYDEDGGYIDEYVRIRMVAKDTAGNEDTAADGFAPCEKLIILNDTEENNPRAYVMMIDGDWVDPVEVYCISGSGDVEVGGSVGGDGATVSHINVYIVPFGTGDPVLIGVDTNFDEDFSILWEADAYPEGTHVIYATVVDYDDNETAGEDATRIQVKIDREGPSVDYANFTDSVEYTDDGIVDHSSFAIHPDQHTWDALFTVNTGDADVESITMQWRHAGDPQGLWRPLSELLDDADDAFDYEPNLNFENGGETRHVWRLHVENWPDQLLEGGPMHFRALAVDQAGNSNALQGLVNEQELTADPDGPTLYDWNDDSITNQVEVGSTTNFEITAQDDYTDVVAVQLEVSSDGGSTWSFYAADEELVGHQIDTGLGLWEANFAWVAPSWVVRDTEYLFRVVCYDSAWNSEINEPPHSFSLTVEDNAAPDRTKIVDILAKVNYTSEDGDAPDPTEDHREHDVWFDMDGDGEYDDGDFLVSEGYSTGVQDDEGDDGIVMVGDECNTFPRWVGEGFLSDPSARNEVKVASEVTLVGRTWADDDGIGVPTDDGIGTVTFWAWPLDASDNPTEPIMIGKDEVAPGFPLYYWHVTWNTLQTEIDGSLRYPDGRYKLTASAIDEEGNEEDLGSLDFTEAIIVVDNTAPEATMDADPATAEIENMLEVERNEWFTLYSRVLEPGTSTEILDEDNSITWYFKRDRDLNLPDSWAMVPADAGLTPEDGNPDMTRPYSFDVQVGELTDPTDPINEPALAVGEYYNFVMTVEDEVCNASSHIAAYADSTTIGARHLTVKVVDTIAPHLEIVEATRALPVRDGVTYGDGDPIVNPTQFHAQATESIEARLLEGHRDLEYVEFVWRVMGEDNWNLIDADLTSEDGINWELGAWDLRTIGAGTWIEVAAIGVDNVGNVDQNPDIVKIYVDYEAPMYSWVSPSTESIYWCDFEYTATGRIMDLIINVDRGTEGLHDDVYDVIWETKLASADSTEWSEVGVATSDDLYDDTLNYYSNTIDLNELAGSNLYDMRVTLVDDAGNYRKAYQWKQVVDVDAPDYVQISNISWEGDDTTQDPSDQDQYTDVTAGTLVEIFGTASDDEPALPNYTDPQTGEWYETAIGYMQFEVAIDLPLGAPDGDANDGEEWRDLGTIEFDPSDLGDISAQTGSVFWNTTGLAEGQYLVRVGAKDTCGNPYPGWQYSDPANVRVVDNEPPVARIMCWDTDLQPHGVNPPSRTTVYALAESDPSIVDVQFQYNMVEAGEETPAGEWVNFGVARQETSQDDYTTETIWSSTIDLSDFDETVTQVWLRALAKDDAGNRYGDNPEDVVPTMLANIVEDFDGSITFEAVRAADLTNGAQVVESIDLMIEAPYRYIVTVDMVDAAETPRLIMLMEETFAQDYPSDDDPENYSPGIDEWSLTRSLDDPTVWRGWVDLENFDDDCYSYKLCVTGLDGEAGIAKWIDHDGVKIDQYPVTAVLGTNGVVKTTGYGDLGIWIDIHPGATDDDGCLLVSPTWAPILDHDEAMYLTPVENTAYYVEAGGFFGDSFNDGFQPLITIQYDETMLPEGANEEDIRVRRWSDYIFDVQSVQGGGSSGWSANGISHTQVDTENNTVSFRVSSLSGGEIEVAAQGGDLYGNIFQLFLLNDSAPVFFSSVWPASPYVTDWWTDADPVMVTYLRDPSGGGVDATEVELLIDGEYWATWLDGEGEADWIRGGGQATLTYVNSSSTVMELVYYHSIFPRDWLADGEHTLTVRFMSDAGEWLDGDQTFYVDRKSPSIEFDGGWLSNPDIINAMGYMNPSNDSLHVKLYDGGTGIHFKPNRRWFLPDFDCDDVIDAIELQYDAVPDWIIDGGLGGTGYPDYDDINCWHQVDWGMKYDVWLVDIEDDQRDIDEIEERILIHQGTADELLPWMSPSLETYNPATDTVTVPVPVLGGGMIGHKDILEITWYSEKTIERYNDGPGYEYGCYVDTVTVGGEVFYMYDSDCTYDADSQEMHIYEQGILDWAGNTGSKYVETRFIIDMEPPVCEISGPNSSVSPDGDLDIHAVIVDDGAGIDDESITVVVTNPMGDVVAVEDVSIADGVVTGTVSGPLEQGEYTVRIRATDRLGNECIVTKAVRSENAFLAMTQSYAAPNPFNPGERDANINFTVSKGSDVTVKVFDFGGNYVTTLAANEHYEAGAVQIPWGGDAADGTDLANGTYIVNVKVSDGARTEETNLKVVLWRE